MRQNMVRVRCRNVLSASDRSTLELRIWPKIDRQVAYISQAAPTVNKSEASDRNVIVASSNSFIRIISSDSRSLSSNMQPAIACATILIPSLAPGKSDEKKPYRANLEREFNEADVKGPLAFFEITTLQNGCKYVQQFKFPRSYTPLILSLSSENSVTILFCSAAPELLEKDPFNDHLELHRRIVIKE